MNTHRTGTARKVAWTAAILLAAGCIEGVGGGSDGDASPSDASQNSDVQSDAAGLETPCGPDLSCGAGTVCVVDVSDPPCTDNGDGTVPCPAGTQENRCGGVGFPCCCGAPPPNTYRCVAASGCAAAGAPDCNCLGEICTHGQWCEGPGYPRRDGLPGYEFSCVTPPEA